MINTLASLLLLAIMIWPPSARADQTLISDKGCTQCHHFSPGEKQTRAKAPDLFYAGDKFQKEWLKKFLQNPTVIRKSGYMNDPGFLKGQPEMKNHPAVTGAEAERLTEYLLSLKLPGLENGVVDTEPLSKGLRARAKTGFERTYSCIACHESYNLAGMVRGGKSGPSLINAGNRLQPDWVYHFLKTPNRFLSQSRMPVYDLDDETARLITRYVMTHKKKDRKE